MSFSLKFTFFNNTTLQMETFQSILRNTFLMCTFAISIFLFVSTVYVKVHIYTFDSCGALCYLKPYQKYIFWILKPHCGTFYSENTAKYKRLFHNGFLLVKNTYEKCFYADNVYCAPQT